MYSSRILLCNVPSYLLLIWTITTSPPALANMENGGMIAGSIRDIAPNLSYVDWGFNWISQTGSVTDDLKAKAVSSLRRHIDGDVKARCAQHNTKGETIVYGVDNVAISMRHLETNNALGQEVVISFNEYCARKQ